MSTWSGIRNKLESDYLCPALRSHIQYFATSYSKSADHEGRAAIRVDGVEVLRRQLLHLNFEMCGRNFITCAPPR